MIVRRSLPAEDGRVGVQDGSLMDDFPKRMEYVCSFGLRYLCSLWTGNWSPHTRDLLNTARTQRTADSR